MSAPAQAQLLTRAEPQCVRYRKIFPLTAIALAISSAATSAESIPVPSEDEALQGLAMVTVGGAGRSLEPMFLQSELDQSLDDINASELDNGVKK